MAEMQHSQQYRTQDWASLMLGLGLFVSPWLYNFTTATTEAMTAWITGAVIMLVALMALWRFAEWEEWVVATLGVWTLAAPFVFGFKTSDLAFQAFEIVGVLLIVAAVWKLWGLHHPSDELDEVPR